MRRLRKKMKVYFTKLEDIKEENEDSDHSVRESQIEEQKERKPDEVEERNEVVSEKSKEVISSEEQEQIDLALVESLEASNQSNFVSSSATIIGHEPNYLIQKQTAD